MTSLSPEPSELTSDALLAMEACHHPIRCIEHIQAHGVVLVVNANDLTGLQVSENVEQFLRLKAIDLVGQPLDILSIPQLTRRVSWFLRQEGEVGPNSFELMLPMPVTQLVADASTASARQAPPLFECRLLRQAPNLVIIELEAQAFRNVLGDHRLAGHCHSHSHPGQPPTIPWSRQ